MPKPPPVPVRPPQKVKATVANIPVGCYDGGGRGKEREKEREKEKDKEREKEKESGSLFSFDVDKAVETVSPVAPSVEEGSSETDAHSVGEAGVTCGRGREANAKEVCRSGFPFIRPYFCLKFPKIILNTFLLGTYYTDRT